MTTTEGGTLKVVLFFSLLIHGYFDGIERCLNTLNGGDLEISGRYHLSSQNQSIVFVW